MSFLPPTRKPTTAAEKAAAQQAHDEIRAAGFDVLEAGTFIAVAASGNERLFAQSTQSIPGTFGHPAKTVEIELSPNREDRDQCPACSGVGGPIETDRCWVQVCPTCNGSGAVPLGG